MGSQEGGGRDHRSVSNWGIFFDCLSKRRPEISLYSSPGANLGTRADTPGRVSRIWKEDELATIHGIIPVFFPIFCDEAADREAEGASGDHNRGFFRGKKRLLKESATEAGDEEASLVRDTFFFVRRHRFPP